MPATKHRITKYGKAHINMLGGEAGADAFETDFLTDTIKLALTTSAHSPNLDTHETFADLTNEVSGGGYPSGGVTLGSKTLAYTAANSFGTTWAASTAYTVGQIVRPTTGNGFLYMCVVAGTSAASEPTWPTTRLSQVTDNTVVWCNVGAGITVIDAADPVYSSVTLTARHGHFYRDSGVASTSPLLWLVEFLDADGVTPADVSPSAADLTVQFNTLGIANHFVLPGVG